MRRLDSHDLRPPLLHATALWALLNVIGLAVAFVWPMPEMSGRGLRITLAGSVILQLAVRALLRRYRPGAEQRTAPDEKEDKDRLDALLKKPNPNVDTATMLHWVFRQSEYRLRTVEQVELSRWRILKTTVSTWTMPRRPYRNDTRATVVPIFFTVKGRLNHDLSVRDGEGNTLPVLPYEQSLLVIVAAWKRIIDLQVRRLRRTGVTVTSKHKGAAVRDGVGIIAGTLERSLAKDPSALAAFAEAQANAWAAKHVALAPGNSVMPAGTTQFLTQFATKYATLVVLPDPSPHFVIEYSYTLDHLELVAAETKSPAKRIEATSFRWVDRVPPRLILDMQLARTSQSHHLQVALPDGNHFADAVIRDETGQRLEKRHLGAYATDQPYFTRSRLGRTSLHVYSRAMDKVDHDITVLLTVNDAPWSSLGGSVLFSWIASIALWLMLRWNPDTDINSTFATLIGVPVSLAGAIFTFRSPSGTRKIASSFMGAVFLATATILTIVGSILALDQSAHWSSRFMTDLNSFVGSAADAVSISPSEAVSTIIGLAALNGLVGSGYLAVRCFSWVSHRLGRDILGH